MKVAALEHRTRTLEQTLKSARSELSRALWIRADHRPLAGSSRDAHSCGPGGPHGDDRPDHRGKRDRKELWRARSITRAPGPTPFVAVNCAALPDTLPESELFGHERGAFTGADRQKPGRFELAARGTLFLDEIGELSPAVQVKLLRVLQEREFQRLGGTATIKANVRVIAATNRDLTAEMTASRFRSDLFYRLAVFNVHLPSLRERGDDVLLLADSFLRSLAAKMGKGDVTLSRDAREVLPRHTWPGNIRELQNAMERALITCEGTLVTAAHLASLLSTEQSTRSPNRCVDGLHGAR
jgi:transcriptional regulator with GAF, ATPase, and Fis domain